MASLGSVRVVVYAGLPDHEPVEIGTIMLPLVQSREAISGIDATEFKVDLKDPFETVRSTLQRIFKEEPDAG